MSRDHAAGAPIILAGHSHCRCLGVPRTTHDGVNRIVPNEYADPRFVGFSGAWPRRMEFVNELARASEGRTVALLWNGTLYLTSFVFVLGTPIDFVLREEPELGAGIRIGTALEPLIVPDRVVHEVLAAEVDSLEVALQRLRASGAARVIIVGTPPPKRDLAERRHREMPGTSHFRESAEALGLDWDSLTVSSPPLLYKAWRVSQRHLADVALRFGAGFVPVPDEALHEQSLADRFAEDDWTHGNKDFGQLMRDRIDAHVRASP